ncbi:MAG: hypothetical protein WD355_10590 [Balneolaceae bacterium]
MVRNVLLLIFFLFVPALLSAQSETDDIARGGSSYSSIGMGIPVDVVTPYTEGMGISGVAFYNPLSVNGANPAMWGLGPYTQGALSVGLQSYSMEDASGSGLQRSLNIDHFQIVFPVVRSRLGISLGFMPVTRSGFSMYRISTLDPEPGSGRDPISLVHNIDGSGGVNKLEFGLGFRITDNVAVGYGGSLMIASRSRQVDIDFTSSRFVPIDYTDTISGLSSGHRFGFFARKGSLFGENDPISFGAAVTLPVSISTERKAETYLNIDGVTQPVDFFEGTRFGSGTVEVPAEFLVGLTYNPVNALELSAEYLQQNWNGASFSYDSSQEQYFTDRVKISGGLQYHPYRIEGSGGFFKNARYSTGIGYDKGHLLIDNEQIETLKFHAGFGILSPQRASSVDVGFHFGFRGTQSSDLIKETIWGVRMSINLAERMFVQSMFD